MASKFSLSIEASFSSAHSLRGYVGRCSRVHGHNYKVVIEIAADSLNELGFVVDYYDVKTVLSDCIDQIDHRNINDIPPFDTLNPTAENLAIWFYKQLSQHLNDQRISVSAVTLYETEDFCIRYTEDVQ